MSNYLETIYFRNEQGEYDYPQQLCDYLVKRYKLSGRLLDVGCGKGNHLVAFNRRFLHTEGIDSRPITSEISKCDLEKEEFPELENDFDVVFSKSVIEHVNNADNIISEIKRVLKPGGRVILLTPDWNTTHEVFWDDYTHVKPWTRKSLQDALMIHGFTEVKSELFRQLPLVWKYPKLNYICDLISLLPHSFKWKDREEKEFRTWVRFSKEKMILATGTKPC